MRYIPVMTLRRTSTPFSSSWAQERKEKWRRKKEEEEEAPEDFFALLSLCQASWYGRERQ